MLLREIKHIFHKELGEIYPKEEIDSFFYNCIEHYLKLERFILAIQPEYVLTKEEEQPLFEALSQLKLQKPLQYILGTAHFMDLELQVNENVLIPRPETEELVQWILDDCQVERSRDLKVLDIGTGSGCIAIALAKHLPNAKVYALDVSKEAIKVAEENAENNGVEVTFIQQDILELEFELELEHKFDIIVSNPPYVRKLEKQEIQNNVKDFEPHLALFVKDNNPLVFYEAIAQFSKNHLVENGKLYFEINQYLGEETATLLKAHNFSEIELRKDIFGNDRMLKATRT
ncbi:peptide chain release factor N(5)-glutamine methyltransferase [Flagellimonas zhangzhouensis]|uniref:Release factor glutamine methyltransferase n=1 Tax=Flagellimonas zhangzhouensis TaxID=1073328 RepID=A0A1H2S103_9FLAO|nr:peptide chain release factor N(5)-glutamine methyltransferase [Allomuricauda zhangzhouensis]SDQ69064.1 release factor glutamine methyltransferase [Allomuricauda zhangzhouensis]SDW24774.1 release factor glutamine methyltransferase [Allomuricauda zhangzhouensis]